ncbi:hypothetical protein ACP70R_025067 [Stipagrostis hirtigluma subsp. patula]
MAKRSRKKRRRNPAANLTDDLIVEILSRLPVKSLCRFKCVSRHWRRLIHHSRLPQTSAGLFYRTIDHTRFPQEARHFVNVWGSLMPPLVRPSLSFVPGNKRISRVLDSCNGLLLCLRTENSSSSGVPFSYIVCNPATKSWVVLPDPGRVNKLCAARLGFDPAVSLHFHVFAFAGNDEGYVEALQIYSCETGAWSYKEIEWDYDIFLTHESRSIFFNGSLHLVNYMCEIVAVDVEGEIWRALLVPDVGDMTVWEEGFLGRYQGQLCYINECDYESDLSLWVLEDYSTDEWILKHHVSIEKLCEKKLKPYGSRFYHMITVLPDCNLILYSAGLENTLMAYDIDLEEVYAIKKLGKKCSLPYIPYVPFYSESLTHGH